MILRPYQSVMVDRMRALIRGGCRSVLAVAPTGSGKTVLTAYILAAAAARGHRSIFLVHRRELLEQSVRSFASIGSPVGVIMSGLQDDCRSPLSCGHIIHVASVQTVSRRIGRWPMGGASPSLIVWDEAHHSAAASWSRIRDALGGAFHIGLTATPCRLDGAGLADWFSDMVQGPTVAELTAGGWLSPYRLYAPPGPSTDGLHTRMGDFIAAEVEDVFAKPAIIGDVVEHYRKLCPGKRAIAFAVSREHSRRVVEQFNAAGISAKHVDGETPADERMAAIAGFRDGRIMVLSNVDLFGEGFDVPAIDAALLLRPTKSEGLYLQQVGRALRPSEGKQEAIILDHAGNSSRHGLPDDERSWSLAPRHVRPRASAEGPDCPIRICPKCYAAQRPVPACLYCGEVFPIKAREVEERSGELLEVERARVAARREQGRTQTFEDLVELGRMRGYKRPHLWAKHVWNARQSRRIQRADRP